MELDQVYMEMLLEHYKHPHHHHPVEGAQYHHKEGNPSCGDVLEIWVKVDEEDRVVEAGFQGRGCIISQAAASILMDLVQGKPLEEVKKLDKRALLEELGIEIGPMRLKCALLPLKVLKAGVWGVTGWPGEDDEDWRETG